MIFSDFADFLTDFFLTICLTLGLPPPPHLKPSIPYGSPIVVFYKK